VRASRMVAAVTAALVAAFLSLGGASIGIAGQPAGKGADNHADNGNGNAYGHEQKPAAPSEQKQASVPVAKTQTGGSHSTGTSGPGNSSQGCDGSHNSDTGHGANHSGPYDNTCDGSPSGNGNGNGKATGKPCAGCVGNADDKNPKGQMPNGSDHNAGYECDRNHGIGRTNPAHTGCRSSETTTETPVENPPHSQGEHNGNGHTPITICHATGSATNPFVQITIDENGLNGHGDHQDDRDIIPAPAEGCPTGTTNTTTPPPPTEVVTPLVTPPTTTVLAPATTLSPATQEVLGVRQTGTSAPGSTPSTPGENEVLGENASGGTAPAATAPAAARQPVAADNAGGSLPFTGTDAMLVLFLGCLLVLTGVTVQRLTARRSS
jgi:hypothetical protein